MALIRSCILIVSLLTFPLYGAGPSLEDLLKSALGGSGQIREAAEDVALARSHVDMARAALYPKADLTVLAAPIFEERGDALRSTSNWSKWGPFLSARIQLAQPIYTFGQIGSYQAAAENEVTAKSGLLDAKKSDVLFALKEVYYGYLMANALDNLVRDLAKFLEDAVDTAEKSQNKKKSNIKPHDVYKLKTTLDDLKQKGLFAKQAKQTAEKAVAWMSTATFESLGNRPLEPEPFEKKSLNDYLALAKSNRGEMRALVAGQAALGALRDAKQAQSYPVIFVGGFGSVGWSPVRDRQPSIYASDPFNALLGGVGLGIKLDLEFARHSAEASEQEAQRMKLKATEAYAVPGIELQVRKAFGELEQAQEGLAIADGRKKTAKKWFVSSAMGWSVGLTGAKDLLEALEGDGLAKKNYIETVYSYNLALANLSRAVGQEVTHLKYAAK